jgi:hypothetical protein
LFTGKIHPYLFLFSYTYVVMKFSFIEDRESSEHMEKEN